jgi:hypothetical protein
MLPQTEDNREVYQLDGVSIPYTEIIFEGVNEHFSGQRNGREGLKPRPLQSLDLTLLDFYLWDYIKTWYQMFKSMKRTLLSESITPDVLTQVLQELSCECNVCRVTNGAHTELH